MRTNEKGLPCPATLAEYREMCLTIGGVGCEAVRFLDLKIEVWGADYAVVIPDSRMREFFMPMMGITIPFNN